MRACLKSSEQLEEAAPSPGKSHSWHCSTGLQGSSLNSTECLLKYSSVCYLALQHRIFQTSSSAGWDHESTQNRMALTSLLHRQCFLKADDPEREHNKLLIKSSRWPLLWLLSFTIASNLFFCMCWTSETEMLNSSLCFLCQKEMTMRLWLHCFLHKNAPYSIYMFHKKLGSEFF